MKPTQILATALFLAGLLVHPPLQAEEIDQALLEASKENIREFALLPDGTIAGSGWEALREEAAEAHFFVIGEQHGTATITRIAAAMHSELAARGYGYMAIEAGPHSVRQFERGLRSGEAAREVVGAAPWGGLAYPFLFHAEEAELAAQGQLLSPAPSEALWGIDQEFVASAALHTAALRAAARTPEQHAAVAEYASAAATDAMWIGSAPPEHFAKLAAAFAGADRETRQMVADLARSNLIYGPFLRRSGPIYFANLERENLMKELFQQHFERAEARDGAPPRVFLKFGSSHAMRGHSSTNVPALGNFLAEWGRSKGLETVNIMIDCLGGTARDIQSGKAVPCQSYHLGEDALLRQLAAGRESVLVDLRPLRALVRSSSAIDDGSRSVIFAFDYYLGIAETEPATLIPAPLSEQLAGK